MPCIAVLNAFQFMSSFVEDEGGYYGSCLDMEEVFNIPYSVMIWITTKSLK